jgi:hypothetical protein
MSKLRMAMTLHICAVVILLFSLNAARATPMVTDTSQNLSNFGSALGNDASSNDVQFAKDLLDDPTFVFTVTNTSNSPQTYTITFSDGTRNGPNSINPPSFNEGPDEYTITSETDITATVDNSDVSVSREVQGGTPIPNPEPPSLFLILSGLAVLIIVSPSLRAILPHSRAAKSVRA